MNMPLKTGFDGSHLGKGEKEGDDNPDQAENPEITLSSPPWLKRRRAEAPKTRRPVDDDLRCNETEINLW